MSKLIKVVDGRDFRYRWVNLFITLEDYENINYDDYDQELFELFENHSFEFDKSKHECWGIE